MTIIRILFVLAILTAVVYLKTSIDERRECRQHVSQRVLQTFKTICVQESYTQSAIDACTKVNMSGFEQFSNYMMVKDPNSKVVKMWNKYQKDLLECM